MEPAEIHDVFARWNKGPLDSYLIEITRDILGYVDPETKKPMVDLILDAAGQKGTGKWTVDLRGRPGRAADLDRRGGLRALPLSPERRASSGRQSTQRLDAFRRRGARRRRSTTSSRRFMPARSSPMPRALRSWTRRHANRNGRSIEAALH